MFISKFLIKYSFFLLATLHMFVSEKNINLLSLLFALITLIKLLKNKKKKN